MFSKVRTNYPDTQKLQYFPNDTVNWTVRYNGLEIIPGSFHLLGEAAIEDGEGAPLPANGSAQIFSEPTIGAHAFFGVVSYRSARSGNAETLNPYPLLVKTKTDFTLDPESIDTETRYSMEGRCRNEVIRSGYMPGRTEDDPFMPFALKLEFMGNNSFTQVADANGVMQEVPAPLLYGDHGDIVISVILAASKDVLYGAQAGAGTGAKYQLRNLRLYYEVAPESPASIPGYFKLYSSQNAELTGTQNTLYCSAAGATEALHMSFMPKAWLQDPTKNKYSTPALYSVPVYGEEPTVVQFGAQAVSYTIADQGSALVAYTMDTREEMLIQTCRAFGVNAVNDSAAYWGTSIYSLSRSSGSYGYALGLAFGRSLDLSRVRFSCNIKRHVADPDDEWAVYMWLKQRLPFGKVAPKDTGALRV